MRVLYIGEIVGKSGVFTVKKVLPRLRVDERIDFVIANADSATGGAGLGKQHAAYLHKLGVDCITTGECVYYKRDIVDFLPKAQFMVRPANYPFGNPGRGYRIFETKAGNIAVVQLLGQAGFTRVHLANPFHAIDEIVRRLESDTKTVILDFHASPTAEKLTMAFHVDGRISAVIGSHAKTLSADARLCAKGTAALTDAGRTGSLLSVGGQDPETRVKEYTSGIPAWSKDGTLGLELQGCIVEIGDDGKALSMETVRVPCREALNDGTRDSDGD